MVNPMQKCMHGNQTLGCFVIYQLFSSPRPFLPSPVRRKIKKRNSAFSTLQTGKSGVNSRAWPIVTFVKFYVKIFILTSIANDRKLATNKVSRLLSKYQNVNPWIRENEREKMKAIRWLSVNSATKVTENENDINENSQISEPAMRHISRGLRTNSAMSQD